VLNLFPAVWLPRGHGNAGRITDPVDNAVADTMPALSSVKRYQYGGTYRLVWSISVRAKHQVHEMGMEKRSNAVNIPRDHASDIGRIL